MKERTVISRACLPSRLPVGTTVLAWLLLDRLDAAGWVFGVVGTLLAVLWILAIYVVVTEKQKPLSGFGA